MLRWQNLAPTNFPHLYFQTKPPIVLFFLELSSLSLSLQLEKSFSHFFLNPSQGFSVFTHFFFSRNPKEDSYPFFLSLRLFLSLGLNGSGSEQKLGHGFSNFRSLYSQKNPQQQRSLQPEKRFRPAKWAQKKWALL